MLQSETPVFQRRLYQFSVIVLAEVGLWAWNAVEKPGASGWFRWSMIALVTTLACFGPISRAILRGLDRIRHPTRRAMNLATLGIAIAASGYFLLTAKLQGRDFFPKMHDEYSYLIGMQILARGRLCMPAMPLPDFFESFYVLVRPVYASIYFIGTALLYVPTVWLHLPTWLMPVMVAGAIVAMMYRVFSELMDGVGGLLAALFVVSLSPFRCFSIMLTGHLPVLLMGLILFWAWMQWRKTNRLRWAAAMGAAAGWAAITRPADAVAFAAPVAIAVLLSLLRPGQRRFTGPVVMVACALPFLALQALFNVQVTGHLLDSPYMFYIRQDMPGAQFGFHAYDPQLLPASTLAQKRVMYTTWTQPILALHTPGGLPGLWRHRYLPDFVDEFIACRLLLILACIGMLGLTRRTRWALWMTLPLFALLYAFNPFFLRHYALLTIPAVTLMVLMGGEAVALAWPRFHGQITSMFVTMLIAVCLTSTWEVDGLLTQTRDRLHDEREPSGYFRTINESLRSVEKPAVVLFTFRPVPGYRQEPVYNFDTAWPDDAPIIRAHDLGSARNQELFDYYAKTQPDRTIYSFDIQRNDPLVRLGKARELTKSP